MEFRQTAAVWCQIIRRLPYVGLQYTVLNFSDVFTVFVCVMPQPINFTFIVFINAKLDLVLLI